jgi:hypothetical protein
MQGKGVILSAASASAAKILSSYANTAHSTYGVNAFSRTFSSLDSCSAALACSNVHFIDDYSMLHSLHSDVVLQRIRTAQGCASINTMLHIYAAPASTAANSFAYTSAAFVDNGLPAFLPALFWLICFN